MASDRSGYRPPAQARMAGTGGVAAIMLAVVLVLTIRMIPPPAAAIDARQEATFAVRSIPRDPPAEASGPPPVPPAPDVPPVQPLPPMSPSPRPDTAMSATAPATSPGTMPSMVAAGAIAVAVLPARDAAAPVIVAAPAPPAASRANAADWRARLLGHLERFRRYPRQAEAARQQGVVRVAITLRRSGAVVAVELVRGSGYPLLDMEARATVRRASPLPAPDETVPGDPVTAEVPIDFALRQ